MLFVRVCFLCMFACVCVCMYGQLLVLDIQPCCSCSFILCYIMFYCNTEIAERLKWWWLWCVPARIPSRIAATTVNNHQPKRLPTLHSPRAMCAHSLFIQITDECDDAWSKYSLKRTSYRNNCSIAREIVGPLSRYYCIAVFTNAKGRKQELSKTAYRTSS